jgi:hypothetical protein
MIMTAERAPAVGGVHTFTSLLNPYLVCVLCRHGVSAWHDAERCGCRAEGVGVSLPCGHVAGTESVCPTWTPHRGCRCPEEIGEVDHPTVFDLGTRVRS